MKGIKSRFAAYRATFNSSQGRDVLSDLAAQAYTMGDGAGKLIAYILVNMGGHVSEEPEGESGGEEKEA